MHPRREYLVDEGTKSARTRLLQFSTHYHSFPVVLVLSPSDWGQNENDRERVIVGTELQQSRTRTFGAFIDEVFAPWMHADQREDGAVSQLKTVFSGWLGD